MPPLSALKVRYSDHSQITRTKSFPEGTNEPMEVLEIIMELWGRCDRPDDIRALGVSLGEFRKSKVNRLLWAKIMTWRKKRSWQT